MVVVSRYHCSWATSCIQLHIVACLRKVEMLVLRLCNIAMISTSFMSTFTAAELCRGNRMRSFFEWGVVHIIVTY